MVLKSGYPFPNRMKAARRLIWFGALAVALLAAAPPAPAEDAPEDAKQAIESAVDGDQIQRDRPLTERARQSLGEVQKQPDIQHDPPEPSPAEPMTPSAPRSPMDLSWLPYLILAVIGVALAVVLLRYLGHRFAGRNAAAAAGDGAGRNLQRGRRRRSRRATAPSTRSMRWPMPAPSPRRCTACC